MTEQDDSIIEPTRPELDPEDPKAILQQNVGNALLALPGDFTFEHSVSGIAAVDLFNLNTLMGAGIEAEVVRTLNTLRKVWDPENDWSGYSFERSSQAFPDVRLVSHAADGDEDIGIGIELKGWFLLAKEGEPSLRYQVSPAACASHDLVCVVPWYLSNAVSGVAQVAEPWVENARYAAEWRDHWWQHVRNARGNADVGVTYPPDAAPYPKKADLVTAKPNYDGGNNYGRLPRCKPLMDAFLARATNTPILGIPANDWVSFLKLHTDTASAEDISTKLAAELAAKSKKNAPQVAEEILSAVRSLRSAAEWLDD